MSEAAPLPSLSLIVEQVATERETMNAHAESLDTKAGVVLGFAGVLVGLGATAQGNVSDKLVFQMGLVWPCCQQLSLRGDFCRAAIPCCRSSGCGRTGEAQGQAGEALRRLLGHLGCPNRRRYTGSHWRP